MNESKKMEWQALREYKELRGVPVVREWVAPTVKFQNTDFLGFDVGILFDDRVLALIQVKSIFRRKEYMKLKNDWLGTTPWKFYATYETYRKIPRSLEYVSTPTFKFIEF